MSEEKINIPLLGGALGLIAAVAAIALTAVYLLTLEPIKNAKIAKTNAALKQVLPIFDTLDKIQKIEAEDKRIIKFYPAKKDGKLIGFAGEGSTQKGFNGNITVLLGLNLDGSIRKVIVTEHKETAGLGTKITDRKREKTILDLFGMGEKYDESKLPENKILDQFDAKVATKEKWEVDKDNGEIDSITGATVTTRAVTDAIYTIASTYVKNKEMLKNGDKK